MNKEDLVKMIMDSSIKRRLYVVILVLLLVAFVLFRIMLAPYLANVNSLRGELKAQENLYKTKLARSENLDKLQKQHIVDEQTLRDLAKRFFAQGEAEIFMKQLPGIVAGFGNKVVALNPGVQTEQLSRSAKLKKHVLSENLPSENELIDFLNINQVKIDLENEEETLSLLQQAMSMLPESKREQFRVLWQQAQSSDYYAGIQLKKMDLQATVQGQFKGILSLLDWFDQSDKIIDLSQISILAMRNQGSRLEFKFNLSIYVIEEGS